MAVLIAKISLEIMVEIMAIKTEVTWLTFKKAVFPILIFYQYWKY